MSVTIDYFYTTTSDAQITVDDIGTCALDCFNLIGNEYLIIITTQYGITTYLQFGPIYCDFSELPEEVNMSYKRFQYDVKKLEKLVDRYINDSKKLISQIQEIDIETALQKIPNLGAGVYGTKREN